MNFPARHFCIAYRYRMHNNINSVIKRCTHILDKQENVSPKTIKSTFYPDYKIIYHFPYITHASLLNKLKRNYIVLFGVSLPAFVILNLTNIISTEDAITVAICSFALLGVLHILSRLCNNLIGMIYYKENNKHIIISYVNYWGKRIDLPLHVDEIILRQVTPMYPSLVHRGIFIKTRQKNLQINMKFGCIIEKSNFHDIFGDVK